MLQVVITPNDNYSLAEMAQMAVEGGAQWLQLRVPGLPDDEVREAAPDVVALCREAGIMLTIENDVALARELELHGVFVHRGAEDPVKLRETLGAEAIIGAEVTDADQACALAAADIDYVALGDSVKDAKSVIDAIRAAGCHIPVVAYRPLSAFSDEEIALLSADGFSGLCGGAGIFSEADPAGRIRAIIAELKPNL